MVEVPSLSRSCALSYLTSAHSPLLPSEMGARANLSSSIKPFEALARPGTCPVASIEDRMARFVSLGDSRKFEEGTWRGQEPQ